MKHIFKFRILTILFTLLLILSACSDSDGQGKSSSGYANSSPSLADYSNSDSSEETPTAVQEQLLIYTGTLKIITKHYEEAIELIFNSLRQAGGYMVAQDDTSNDQHRSSKIVVRIPSKQFFTWIEGVEQIPNSKFSKTISAEDVSEEYVDLAARQEAKQLVIDKYKEYIQMATTADDLIRYTNELAELQEEIDAVQARLRYLQNRVMYSTITISVNDDAQTPFFKELHLKDKFSASWKNGINGLVFVATSSIFLVITLLPIAIVGGLVIVLVIRHKKKKKKGPM